MRVCLFGWFGFRNLGDDLLLSVTLDRLSGVAGSVEVGLKESGYLAEMLGGHSEVGVRPRSVVGLFGAALRNDCLVIGPGGLFPHPNFAKVLTFFLVTLWWKLLGRRVAWFCFGASRRQGPASSALWRGIAGMSDLFVSRDDNVFAGAGIRLGGKAFVAADAAFTIAPGDVAARSGRIAVCLANLFDEGEAGYAEFLDDCERVVRHACGLGCGVDLLSFTAGSDESLNEEVASRVPGARLLTYEETMAAALDGLRYRAVVAMRFHAVVLALIGSSPVVPVAYADKTEALAKRAGLSDRLTYFCKGDGYFGRAIPLDPEGVSRAVEEALGEREPSPQTESFTKDMRRIAMEAFALLERIVRGVSF